MKGGELMQPLLKIQSVPIEISYTSKRATLKQSYEIPRVNVTRQRGRANIRTELAKVKIDSYETRASAGLKSPKRSIKELAQTGRSDAAQATRTYADDGNAIMDSRAPGAIAEIAMSKVLSTSETIMTFIPSVRPEMWMEGGTISFDYSMDQLNFDWDVKARPEMEYVPGELEFTVSQYPQVIIEYVGPIIYTPPSADPDYVPPPSLDVSL